MLSREENDDEHLCYSVETCTIHVSISIIFWGIMLIFHVHIPYGSAIFDKKLSKILIQ